MVLLSIGAFVAVTTLVGLMRRKRDEVLAELTAQAKDEQHKKRLAEQEERGRKEGERRKSGQSLPALPRIELTGRLASLPYTHDQATLHRNRRLPDERAGQRDGRGRPAQAGLRAGRATWPRPT